MAMAEVTDGAITAAAGITTAGVEVAATTMVGGITVITGDSIAGSRDRYRRKAGRHSCPLLGRERARSRAVAAGICPADGRLTADEHAGNAPGGDDADRSEDDVTS